MSFPGAYLLGLLAGGARPLAYRSGVYLLLGAPPQVAHRMTFLPPMPPAGFQYEEHRPPHVSPGPSTPAPLPDGSSRMPEDGAFAGEGRREQEGRQPLGEEIQQESLAAPQPPEQKKAAPVRSSAAPLEGAQNELAQSVPVTRFEVPAPEASAPERLPNRSVELILPGLTRKRSSIATPADALQGKTRPPAEERSSEERLPPTPVPSSEASLPLVAPVDEYTSDAAPGGLERIAGTAFTPPAPSEEGAMKPRPHPARHAGVERSTYGVAPARRQLSSRGAMQEPGPHEAVVPMLPARVRGSEAVENVRRAAMKQAVRQAPVPEAGPPEPSTAPARSVPQPVVIVRPAPAVQRRVPRAFWASSPLRSTHLRMLR